MSTYNYARARATAERLLARFGQTGAIRRAGAATGDPWNPTPGANTDYPAQIVVTGYDAREIDGTRIQATDKKALVGGVEIDPATSDDLVEADGTVWEIVAVERLKPAETTVLHTLQIRR